MHNKRVSWLILHRRGGVVILDRGGRTSRPSIGEDDGLVAEDLCGNRPLVHASRLLDFRAGRAR